LSFSAEFLFLAVVDNARHLHTAQTPAYVCLKIIDHIRQMVLLQNGHLTTDTELKNMDYHRKVLKELRQEWNTNIAKEFEHNFEEKFDLEVAIYYENNMLYNLNHFIS
jgi:hypothetical protein